MELEGLAGVEVALCTVEIALTRRSDGRYVARVSFEDEPSWMVVEANSAQAAYTRAARIAQSHVTAAAGGS